MNRALVVRLLFYYQSVDSCDLGEVPVVSYFLGGLSVSLKTTMSAMAMSAKSPALLNSSGLA